MARAKPNEALRSKTKPNVVDELTRGIATLRELSVQIDDLGRDGFPYREAVRARTELSFRETIRRLFGEKSPEYQAHKNHKLKVGSRTESAQSSALLKEFIAALEVQKADLLCLKPDEVIAVVTAEADRPVLTVVPPIISPDSSTTQSAGSLVSDVVVSVPSRPTPVAIATATLSAVPSSLPPSTTVTPVVVPSATMAAADTLSLATHDAPAAGPVQQPLSVGLASAESPVVSQVNITPTPANPSPIATDAASATSPPPNSSTAKAAEHASISSTTIPPMPPAMSAIPQGTIPPIPHMTLRPRPAPLSDEPPAPAPATATVTTPLTPTPSPVFEPPQPLAPSLATNTVGSGSVPTAEIRNAPPIVETTTILINTTPPLQQEPPAHQIVAQATTPVQSLTPASTQSPVPEKTQDAKRPVEQGTLETLRRICARFHLVARQLRLRKEYRPTLEINDEYDLQDLFYALLRLQFDEVGTEEWTPAYTNGARRTSYLLDWEKTVVIVKQTRSGLTTRDLAEQIATDTARYSARPNGATLVCFVYDPDGRVGNPRGLEADLSSTEGCYSVEVIVAPK